MGQPTFQGGLLQGWELAEDDYLQSNTPLIDKKNIKIENKQNKAMKMQPGLDTSFNDSCK